MTSCEYAAVNKKFELVHLEEPCSQGLSQLFPEVGMTIQNNILEVLPNRFVSPVLQSGNIDKITM